MPTPTILKFKRTIQIPPAEVYRAFTHATLLRDWLCQIAQTDARIGGQFYARWSTTYFALGQYTALEPGRKVAFTWQGSTDPGPSQVQVALQAKGQATVLTLTHKDLGSGKKWAQTIQEMEQGWAEGLENLQSVLEVGVDLREVRRPRMGILLDDFNPLIAAELGVPAKKGVRLGGVGDGTGAQAAGLQKDDVLIKLADAALSDIPSLGAALQRQRAGNVVPVTFYRSAKKQTVALTLGAPPPPEELPPTGAALANLVQPLYAAVQNQFEQQLAEVTDAVASVTPAPNEWNAKQLVAHFIACERDLQSWIADMLQDNVIGDSLQFRPNITPRLDAIITRYPTLPALLAELQAASAETLNLLRNLPPEFIAHRKHFYRRIVSWVTQVTPSHLSEEHQTQLQATLAVAQK